ncbi:hypothetical protein JHK86_051449 [Glycine max]|nr:hypothetical protein JHK86_051449 [Glycine max]
MQIKERFVISKSSYNPFSYPKIVSWNATLIAAHGMAFNVMRKQVMSLALIPVAVRFLVQWVLIAASFTSNTFKVLILLIITSINLKSHRALVSFHTDIFTNITSLQLLSLHHCELYGEFPAVTFHLPKLRCQDLGNNEYLTEYNLQGAIPNSLFKLENLEVFSMAYNLLEGELELEKFLMLKRLLFVRLSFNKLSIISRKNPSNVSLSQIQLLGLRSCNLIEFPNFLQYLAKLAYLYMSNNNVNSLPSWIWGETSLLVMVYEELQEFLQLDSN